MWIFPTIQFRIERWRFNKEYGVYVSTLGNFKDRHKRNLPVKIDQGGYCAIKTDNGTYVRAHRLVLKTWRPIPNSEKLTVDHLNHNKRDNSLRNLEWVTKNENRKRAKIDQLSIDCELIQSCPVVQAIKQQAPRFQIENKIYYNKRDAVEAMRQISSGYSYDAAYQVLDDLITNKNTRGYKCIHKPKQIYIKIIK